MGQGKDESILVMIQINWIREVFKGLCIFTLISNIGGVGPWQRYALSECSFLRRF